MGRGVLAGARTTAVHLTFVVFCMFFLLLFASFHGWLRIAPTVGTTVAAVTGRCGPGKLSRRSFVLSTRTFTANIFALFCILTDRHRRGKYELVPT